MNENEALDIASDFQKYLRTDDKSFIENYTKAQIKCALSLISHSRGSHQWYKEMERRIEELEKEEKSKQMKTDNGVIKNGRKEVFYSKWWFKLLLAPILVGLFLLYFQNRASDKQVSGSHNSYSNDIKQSNISGDIVGRDKIIYPTTILLPKEMDRKKMDIKDKLKKLYGEISVLSDYPIPSGNTNALQEYEERVNRWVSNASMWIEINIGFGAREKFLNRGEGGRIWSSSYEDRYNRLMSDLKGYKLGLEELIKSDEIWFEIDTGKSGRKRIPEIK